jgi:prolyl oligopeptidase
LEVGSSFKYAATLQALASHDTPLLIRIETNSAHGASGLDKQLDTAADIYSFIMFNLGVTPVVPGAQTAPSTRY